MPDVLGPDYRLRTLPMADDYEGAVVASLVERRAAEPTGRAVLYIHGFTDYFFQTHLAEHFVDQGIDFYGLDLRKYGRSLLPHQTRGLVRSVTEYFPEIDEAIRIIREEDGHDDVIINAHSTGGLIAALWADRVRGRGLVQGLLLNSPFLDLNVPAHLRVAADALRGPLSRMSPRTVVPLAAATAYGTSLHRGHRGSGTSTWSGSRSAGSRCTRSGWPRSAGRSAGSTAASAWTSPSWCSARRGDCGCVTSRRRPRARTSCSIPGRSPAGPPASART
ncbi:alpha/beta fold hydrolase [Streptosporangium lutulentum]